MGCICSLDQALGEGEGTKPQWMAYKDGNPHPLVTENADSNQKAKALEGIKKNDALLATKILEEVAPTENLGMPGDNYTLLHAAAEFNSFQAMGILTSWIKANKADNAEAIVNITDRQGNTPAVVCVNNNSSETFYVLLKKGMVSHNRSNHQGKGLLDICQNVSKTCFTLLEKVIQQNLPKDQRIQRQQQEDQEQQEPSDKYKVNQDKEIAQREAESIISKVEKLKDETKQEVNNIQASTNNVNVEVSETAIGKLLERLASTDSRFVDYDFPATVDSLSKDPAHESYKEFKRAKWERPDELFQSGFDQIQLFDNIDPNDISQGILGVCYFLSALSAIAEFPSRLTKVFMNKVSNKYGAYGVKFFVQGIPTEIIVDDQIPCYGKRAHTPLFSKPKGKELWVLLAEKAWGKLYKSFAACEAGIMSEAFEYLLGCPSTNYQTERQTVDEIWNIISNADNQKHVMGAGTQSWVTEDMGLVAGHAYSVISAHEVGQHRILKLRNPWGSFEWNGDFGDKSSLWTDEIKRKVGYSDADDGIFCMTVDDFKKMFGQYDVAMYNEGWEYSYKEVQSAPNHAEYFRFNVSHPCDAYFRIHQEDKRHYSAEVQESFLYSGAEVLIAYVEDDGTYTPVVEKSEDVFNVIDVRSTFAAKDRKVELKRAGQYIVRTKVKWQNQQRNKFVVSAYAPVKIDLEHIIPVKGFLRNFFISASKFGKRKEMKFGCSGMSDNYSNYSYMLFQNEGAKTWNMNITYTLQNLKFSKASKAVENKVKLCIPPGGKEIVYLKSVDVMQATSFGYSSQSSYQ